MMMTMMSSGRQPPESHLTTQVLERRADLRLHLRAAILRRHFRELLTLRLRCRGGDRARAGGGVVVQQTDVSARLSHLGF